MLDTQIQIYSVDTSNFYSNHESRLHRFNHNLRMEKNRMKEILLEKEKEFKEKYKLTDEKIKQIQNDEYDYFTDEEVIDEDDTCCQKLDEYCFLYYLLKIKKEKIKKTKNELLQLLSDKVELNIQSNGNHHIRQLKESKLNDNNIISVFESSLTRMIGIKPDEFTDDFMVVQVFYFDVLKDIIYNGFEFKGEKYRYFTSSAGQIRTKKCVFIKESVWNKYEKTLMCGLTIDAINAKGGNNPNKHLAYLALTNSATDVWNEFNIDKTIVINDFETDVEGEYDFIDDSDYSITRMTGKVPVPHTDGCGMILPNAFCKEQKNVMVRLPWVKGLLGVFDYLKFIEVNNCSPTIKDIYGIEHNVIDEDIQVILTKSQFKLWKYYDSWEQYKEYYKEYNCTAGITNIEEDRIKYATINYQMLQSLTDITDDEINNITMKSVSKLENVCNSIESLKNAFGISSYNQNQTYLQKSVELYSDLMNDEFFKDQIRNIKDNLVKCYKSGALEINGKYTFVLPDLYAACEYWFKNIKQPKGLLQDGEVFCWLFRRSDKLDCLRSPHLYLEHSIRKNLAWNLDDKQEDLRKWFTTNAIYTSTHDLISKILQFDVDGDKLLVISDKILIDVAERNIKKFDVVPLYYDMKKANPSVITNEVIYKGLIDAFVGGNIGIYSNTISKIWNSDVFINGTDEEKQNALDIIKLLVAENNYVIDYAKTLYKPERPDYIHEQIQSYAKQNVPHFFVYAKDKEEYQVQEKNDSLVNKISELIKNPRLNTRGLGLKKIEYRYLVSNPNIKFDIKFTDRGRLDEEHTEPLIIEYLKLNKKYHFKINMKQEDLRRDLLTHSQLRENMMFKKISTEVTNKLSKYGYSETEIIDILVKFLYHYKPSSHKSLLWFCYGKQLYMNVCRYFEKQTQAIQCTKCGEWFEVNKHIKKSTFICDKCKKDTN